MKIEYTYAEPEERPIKKAEFQSMGGRIMAIGIGHVGLPILHIGDESESLSKESFAEYTALVNRINRQIGN